MDDRLMGEFVVGRHADITVRLYLPESHRVTAAGAARRPYFLAHKGGDLVLDTRVKDDGGTKLKPFPRASRPAGFEMYTHILGGRIPLSADQAVPIEAAETEARREIDAVLAKVGADYRRRRAAGVLAAAGGATGAADIEANHPGGYAAYERAELARDGRRDAESYGMGLDHNAG